MSGSEAHPNVERAIASDLTVLPERSVWSPVSLRLLEFMRHGVRYVWPATVGPIKRAVPTSFGTAPLRALERTLAA